MTGKTAKPSKRPNEGALKAQQGRGVPAKLTAAIFERICASLAESGAKYRSCEEHGFYYSVVSSAIRDMEGAGDDSWRDAWNLAEAKWRESLEVEANRRGRDGIVTEWKLNPLTGERVPVKMEFSDRMLEVLMKGHFPERYRDNIHHSGLIGLEPVDAFANLTSKAKRAIRAIIMADLEEQREAEELARREAAPPVIEGGELIAHQLEDLRTEAPR
jgi:hypothetical protein